ncbi:MAG: sulfatase/phosphatase domain-containing protein, partial [Planctomycetota bacterium]|nr:sulfatase/phosphatase domain-containing protein [Planctomycetota bacterium]
DNGGLSTSEGSPTSNLPLRGGKGWLYEGGIREPFLISHLKSIPARVDNTSVCTVDFYPTLLELAEIKPKPRIHVDGVSLASLLQKEKPIATRDLYWHYPHYSNQGGFPGGVIRRGSYKLIERFEDGSLHLFNLANDLSERNDVKANHPELVSEMRKSLHQWYDEVDAKFLRAKPDGPEAWRPDLE